MFYRYAILKLPSLSCPHTHRERHMHARRISLWLRTRISPAFGTFVDWYIVLGTLVASRCSRFSSSRLLDSCASLYAGRFLERKTRKLNSSFSKSQRFSSATRVLKYIFFFLKNLTLFFYTLRTSSVVVLGCLEIHPIAAVRDHRSTHPWPAQPPNRFSNPFSQIVWPRELLLLFQRVA